MLFVLSLGYDLESSSIGNDPHFFLPLTNGDHLCFSIQGQPDFAFNLINDKYIQLNGQFVLPAYEKGHTIANVSTFLGDLGLVVKDPETGNSTIIEVSAQTHSVKVGNSFTIVKDKPVTVDVSDTVSININSNDQTSKLKDEIAWLYINTKIGFGLKVRFYKKHLDLFLTKTDGLTKNSYGLIGKAYLTTRDSRPCYGFFAGQFLTVDVRIDTDYNVIKLGDRKPISVKKAPAWPFLGIFTDCWHAEHIDNQATGVIEGVYTDYVVEHLVPNN